MGKTSAERTWQSAALFGLAIENLEGVGKNYSTNAWDWKCVESYGSDADGYLWG
jgi:hypothetical protein